MLDDLTGLQAAFIDEWIKDFNGTQAAKRAGYDGNDNSLAVIAHDNLRLPKIRQAIKERLSTRALSADEVLIRLADNARLDLSTYFIKKRGKHYIDLDAIQRDGLGHLIKEISYDRRGNPIVKFDDRQNALIQLGKAHGIFTDKIEHSGPDGQPLQFSEIVINVKSLAD